MNIRARLRALIFVTLLPASLFGMAGANFVVQKERSTLERGVRDRASALMTAIEAEMQASIAALEVLARSPSLQNDNLTAFRAEAESAVAARKGSWENIVLTDAQSQEMLINLLLPPNATLPKTQDAESIVEAVQHKRGAVGNVAIGGVLRRPIFAIRVPVFRGDSATYVIAAVLDVRTIARIAEKQPIPESWAVAVLDGNYRFVFRRPKPPQGLEFATESLRTAVERAEHGWEHGVLLDGTRIYRAFQRSSMSRWSTSVAVPSAVVEQGLHALWLLIFGYAAMAALGLWVAWWLASRISRPIAALAAAAPAVGRGDVSAIPAPGPVDEVRQLSQALSEAAVAIREREERQRLAEQALRAADRAKDEFLAMLGHELRNPLSSVSNAAQLLKLSRQNAAVVDNVSDILTRQVDHMTRLVDDLLEVGRVTGGKVRLERAPVELAQLASELIKTWNSEGRFLHHDFRSDVQPVWAMADRARVQQIMSNLIDNALKYTPARGRIDFAVRRQGTEAVIEISDTGEGLSPELIERVFDLFVQGERTLARAPGGLGIGLTMVKRLVELHEGSIQATSAGPGKGAQFTVTLPAIMAPAITLAERQTAAATARAQRILIVEDNPDARESLAALLRVGGQDVQIAETGTRALEIAAHQAFDLILIDIGLPDIDGYEIARRLRQMPVSRSARLVALTGYGTTGDRHRALAAGFDEHYAKPMDAEKLETMLDASATQALKRSGTA